MFLLLWYSPPEIISHGKPMPEPPPRGKPRVIYVLDDRKHRREDEEIIFL